VPRVFSPRQQPTTDAQLGYLLHVGIVAPKRKDHLTNRTGHLTGAWLEIATGVYLDHRHRNWVLAEEMGDVVFIATSGGAHRTEPPRRLN
jgi:hypothetical protein